MIACPSLFLRPVFALLLLVVFFYFFLLLVLLFRPTRTTTDNNLVTNVIHRSQGRPFPVSVNRLRATWIVTHLAAGTPVQALLDAAGIETIGALGRFMAHVPAPDPRDARAALTKRARAEGCRAPVHGHVPKPVEGP